MKKIFFIISLFFSFVAFTQTNHCKVISCSILKDIMENESLSHDIGNLDSIILVDVNFYFKDCNSFKISRTCKNCPDFYLLDSSYIDSVFIQISHDILPKNEVDLFVPLLKDGISANKVPLGDKSDKYRKYFILNNIVIENQFIRFYFFIPSKNVGGVLHYKKEKEVLIFLDSVIRQY
jgi:hypothetical protein